MPFQSLYKSSGKLSEGRTCTSESKCSPSGPVNSQLIPLQSLEDPFADLDVEGLVLELKTFSPLNSVLPRIPIKIGDRWVNALIDSGAAVNAIRSGYSDGPLTPTAPQAIRLAFGTSITPCLGEQEITFTLSGSEYSSPFKVLPELHEEAILGLPFLIRYQCTLDCGRRSLHIGTQQRSTVYWGLPPNHTDSKNVELPDTTQTEGIIRDRIKSLLEEHDDLFEIPKIQETTYSTRHSIVLKRPVIVNQRPYPMSAHKKALMYEQVDELLQRGVIEPSSSNYSSPPVIIERPEKSPTGPSKPLLADVQARQQDFVQRYHEPNMPPAVTFNVGDQVMVRHKGTAFEPAWRGPFTITAVISNIMYEVNCNGSQGVYHVDKLRPAPRGNDLDGPLSDEDNNLDEDQPHVPEPPSLRPRTAPVGTVPSLPIIPSSPRDLDDSLAIDDKGTSAALMRSRLDDGSPINYGPSSLSLHPLDRPSLDEATSIGKQPSIPVTHGLDDLRPGETRFIRLYPRQTSELCLDDDPPEMPPQTSHPPAPTTSPPGGSIPILDEKQKLKMTSDELSSADSQEHVHQPTVNVLTQSIPTAEPRKRRRQCRMIIGQPSVP